MRYLRAYSFFFQSPNWARNLLLLSLCLVIPVIGQITLSGYMFQMIERMHRRGSDEEVPDFDFNQFLEYLLRGIWPFLADFVLSMLFTIPYLLGYLGVIFVWVLQDQGVVSAELAIGVTITVVVVVLALVILMIILRYPVVVRCGLQQDFKVGFSPGYLLSFLRLVGGEVLLSLVFILFTGLAVMAVGLMLCCVGIIPAAVLILIAQYHLFFQLYELYLQRGGEPVPLKPMPSQASPLMPEEIAEDSEGYPT
ncbi:MAG: DUF4013 domain-containing protein [Gemmatales bacterium]|nr:DUF4013 domain-containing protein [Gemmatales bacterium]MDW8385702.1 DUF4013 domain-containing protein [Gemmatales bacterium]